MAPFAVATLGVFLALTGPSGHLDARLGALAGALTLAILASPFVVPFSRLPRWTEAIPPLSYFVVVVLLRQASNDGFSGFESLVLLPVVWMALHGTRRELLVSLAGASLALVIPLLGPGNHPAAWLHLVVWAFVAPAVGLAVFALVRGLEDRTREAADRTEALRESEEATERILGAVGEGVLGVDRQRFVTFANTAAARLVGREPGELVGRPLEEVVGLRTVGSFALRPGRGPCRPRPEARGGPTRRQGFAARRRSCLSRALRRRAHVQRREARGSRLDLRGHLAQGGRRDGVASKSRGPEGCRSQLA